MDISNSTREATNFDFDHDPPKFSFVPKRPWHINRTNASICSPEGDLIFYTNGQIVYASDPSIIEDTINYDDQWDNWNYTNWMTGELINDGLPTMQGALILPLPGSCKTSMLGTTSTDDQELEIDVSIYPDPTADYLTINSHNYLAMDAEVRMYNVLGNLAMTSSLEGASIILDLSGLTAGIYLYEVYDESKLVYYGK